MNIVSTAAIAGPISSGGGQGVLCKSHGRETVELLDLWEARVIYGRKITTSNTAVAQQIDAAMDSLKYSLENEGLVIGNEGRPPMYRAEAWKALVTNNAKVFIPQREGSSYHHIHGGQLELTTDAYEVVHPDSCQIVQLVRYTDTNLGGSILIDQDKVDKMDRTNQAALYAHEAFYAWLRQEGREPSSLRTRRAIGFAFSGQLFQDPHRLLQQQAYACTDADNQIAILKNAVDDPESTQLTWSAVIVKIDGRLRVGYDGIDGANYGNSNQPFNWISPGTGYEDQSTLGQIAGFDFNTRIKLRTQPDGSTWADVELTNSPDLSEPYKVTLGCHAEPPVRNQ